MQDSGFTVNEVAKGGRIIDFSGTAGQVESAFHTEMHTYMVNGEMRSSNSTDISIPQALSAVVAGVGSLNNFRLKAAHEKPQNVVVGKDGAMYPAIAGTFTPDYTSLSSGRHYVGAADLATIFDTNPLLTAGINGKGVKIGIIGQTDILLGDVQIYRQLFNLPFNNPNFITIGADPGTIGDDIESDLDVELSGGIAPMATIDFYTSGNSYYGGGIFSPAEYMINNNSDDIISLSYGGCEADQGGFNGFINAEWEQAASQGISVFVSSGDAGPAGCDNDNVELYAVDSYAVNGLGSTPYNVAVGGTMFNDTAALGVTNFWGAGGTAPFSSALSYIPEIPWNEGLFDIYGGDGIAGGGSGVSFIYGTPSYQAGFGVPSSDPTPPAGADAFPTASFQVPGPHRLLPDVSMQAAGGHDGTIFCSEGSCQLNSDGTVASIGVVGGTSVAAPSFAGVQALINQKSGGRQGNPNFYYYRLANAQSQTNCVSATYVAGTSCNFHDITTGNNFVPSNSSGTTYLGWQAGPGYDMAVGLGSPDATNLASHWSTVSFNATTTAFTLTPTTSAHGATYNISITVTPVSGTGVPTGDVSVVAKATNGAVGFYTLSGGTASGTLTGLPGGTYTVAAHYAGDTTFGGSTSTPITVTVGTETPVVAAASYVLTTSGSFGPTTSFSYGSNVYINMGVAPNTGVGIPSGNITLALSRGTSVLTPYTTGIDPNGTTIAGTLYAGGAYFDAGLGFSGYDIASTYPLLPVGTYTATASYAGDSTFTAATATPITFVVGPVLQTLSLQAATATVAPAGTVTLNASVATVAAAAGGVPATGNVTFTDTTVTPNVPLGTGKLAANGALVFNTNLLITPGTHTIVASYTGDGNYSAATSSAVSVTVGGTPAVPVLTITPSTAPVGTSISLKTTFPAGLTGTITYYNNGVSLGDASITAGTSSLTIGASTFTAGTHTLTAVTSGDGTYQAGTSNPVVLTTTQNTPTLQLTNQAASAGGTSFAMNALLTPAPAGSKPDNPAPAGPVNFTDAANGAAATVLGSAVPTYLPGGYQHYVASFTTKALVPGYHTLGATFTGDANYATATSNTQAVVIGLTTTALTATNAGAAGAVTTTLTARVTPAIANAAVLGGTVSFYSSGVLLGTSPIVGTTATATLSVPFNGAGPTSFTAVYSGDANYYTSTSNTQTLAIDLTTTSLTATNAGAAGAVTTTLTAHVTPVIANTAVLGGTVSFYDSGVLLGTSPIAGTTATATLSVPFQGTGPTSFTAVYSGDANYYTSTSSAVLEPYFTIAVNPILLNLAAGSSGSVQVIATTYNGYTGTAPLSCSGLPVNTTCAFSYTGVSTQPASGSTFVFNGTNGVQAQQITLTITSTQAHSAAIGAGSGLLWVPAALLAMLLGLRRKQLALRSRQMMLLAVLLCGALAMTACNSFDDPAPSGSTLVTVTANGMGASGASPNEQPVATIDLTIK